MIQKLVPVQVKFPKNPVENFGFKVGLKNRNTGYVKIAIENHPFSSLIYLLKIVIFQFANC